MIVAYSLAHVQCFHDNISREQCHHRLVFDDVTKRRSDKDALDEHWLGGAFWRGNLKPSITVLIVLDQFRAAAPHAHGYKAFECYGDVARGHCKRCSPFTSIGDSLCSMKRRLSGVGCGRGQRMVLPICSQAKRAAGSTAPSSFACSKPLPRWLGCRWRSVIHTFSNTRLRPIWLQAM
jgi:hypothetical protein